MVLFGQAVYLWRMERGLTQGELARAAGVPRPALSALERGRLEPTLKTIRRLAHGLRVRPGLLVDGEPPRAAALPRLSRARLERLAGALCGEPVSLNRDEKTLVPMLTEILRPRLRLAGIPVASRGSARRLRRSWLFVSEWIPSAELAGLVSRIEKHAQRLRTHP